MTHTHDMVECPKHEGNFDCNPFCSTCEGEQEYCQTCDNTRPCQTCGTPVPTDIHAEELGYCIPCQHEYFDGTQAELDAFWDTPTRDNDKETN